MGEQKAAATEAAKTRAQEAKNFAAVHKNKIDTETAKQLKDADFTSKEKFLLIDKLRSKLSRGGTGARVVSGGWARGSLRAARLSSSGGECESCVHV